MVLRIYWGGEEEPSVESPLGDFFCCGFGVSYPVNSMPVVVNPTRGFNCYFPMPFRKKARITVENQCDEAVHAFFYQVDYCLTDELPDEAGYFHAQWRRQRLTQKENGKTVEQTYCTPFMGYPYYSHHDTFIHHDYHNNDQMPQRSFYRWHIMDPILFEKEMKVTIQQIGVYHGGME